MIPQPGNIYAETNETMKASPSDIIFIPDGRFLSLRFISKPESLFRISSAGVTSLLRCFGIPEAINERLSTETRASLFNDLLETESGPLHITLRQSEIVQFSC
jgi:hypothetical protein